MSAAAFTQNETNGDRAVLEGILQIDLFVVILQLAEVKANFLPLALLLAIIPVDLQRTITISPGIGPSPYISPFHKCTSRVESVSQPQFSQLWMQTFFEAKRACFSLILSCLFAAVCCFFS